MCLDSVLNNSIRLIIKIIPCSIFMASGLTKLLTLYPSVTMISELYNAPLLISLFTLVILICIELIVGLGVLWANNNAIRAGIVLLIIFSLVGIYKTIIGDTSECLCFGTLFDSSWGIPLVIRNVALIGILILLLKLNRNEIQSSYLSSYKIRIASFLLIVVTIISGIFSLRGTSLEEEQIYSLLSIAEPLNTSFNRTLQSSNRVISIILFSPECWKCQTEAPEWDNLAERMEQETNIILVAVSMSDSIETLKFSSYYSLQIPVFFLPRRNLKEVGVMKVPQYLFINGNDIRSYSLQEFRRAEMILKR